MGPLAIAGILAAAGLLKSELVDRPKEKRQRQLAAATQRYSPWTGLQANEVKETDSIGTGMQYGMAGAQFGQNMEDHELQTKLTNSEITKNNAVSNTLPGSPASPTVAPTTSAWGAPPSIYSNGLKPGRSANPYSLGTWNYYSI